MHNSTTISSRGRWHYTMLCNKPTCYIDYNIEEFIVHVRYPIGYLKNYIWYYPCIFNGKLLRLVPADLKRMGLNNYGTWGTHYI
jgi:hypothetical protein